VLDSPVVRPPDPLRGSPDPAEARPARMDLSIILVSYKSRELLLAALPVRGLHGRGERAEAALRHHPPAPPPAAATATVRREAR
jgi:hypothetical protein